MTLRGRLLGLSGDRAAPATVAKRTPPPAVSTQNVGWSTPGVPMYTEWNADSAIQVGYYGYIYAYRCARTIATTIGGLPFRAGASADKPTAFNLQSPLARLLGPPPGTPAPQISSKQLLIHSIVSYIITGRFAWETPTGTGSTVPASLWPLIVAKLTPIPTAGGKDFFSGYQYQLNSGTQDLTPQQVFYAWRPSQNDWRQPESVLQAAALPLSLGVAMDRYMTAFMRNNMVSPHMVVTPAFEEESMRRAFQDQFVAEMTGYDNAGRTSFAEYEDETGTGQTPNVQVIDLGTTPIDADILNLQKWVRDTVCDAFGVPVSIIGQASERTYANSDQEHKNYWTGTILGLIEELLDHINLGLAPRFGSDVGWFDLSGVEALQPPPKFMQQNATDLVTAGIVTASEVREDMGLPPELPVGDPSTMVEPIPAIDDTPTTAGGSTTGGTRDTSSVEPSSVLAYLADNYPQKVLGWVKDAEWTLNTAVPLSKIKMARRPGARDPEKVAGITQAIKDGKTMDPVVLVDTGEGQYEVADGYHRTMAFEKAGRPTIPALIGTGVGKHGPWETEMHAAKLNTGKHNDKAAASVGERMAAFERLADLCVDDEGDRYDVSPIGLRPNWITKVGGLPLFVRAVAHALIRDGHTESEAIQIAIGVIYDWAEGKGNVTAKTRAKAAATVASWEAKKAAAHGTRDGFVTETGAGAPLVPVAGSPMSVPHLPTRSAKRGICGLCGQPASALIHTSKIGPSRRRTGARHAGPTGHSHVRTGHHSGARAITARQVNAHADAMEPAAEQALKAVFAQQRKATIDRLNGNRGKSMIRAAQDDPNRQDDDTSPAPLIDAGQVFDFGHWVAKTQDALHPMYAAIGALGQERLTRFGSTPTAHDAVAAALKARSVTLAQTVSTTTLTQIVQALTNGVAQGDSIAELTKAVNHIFDDADQVRAQLIARTEVIGALNTAADTHAAALGPDVVAGKEWIATHDDRTRPMHREADAQIQHMGVPFLVGGFPMQHPGDPSAPADEVCNCRCTTGYLTPAEYAQRSGIQMPSIAPPIAA